MLNRRDFVKMAAAAGVAAIMGAEVLSAEVGELETAKPDQGNPIRVDNEWGRLREVIVGIVPDNAIVPPPVAAHFKDNSPQNITCFQQCHEKPAKQALPEAFKVGRQQVEALVKIYEKTSIKVHRPRPHTETELHLFKMGGAPLYARDSMLVVGQNVIELSLRNPSRRKEIFAYREMLARRLAQTRRVQYVSISPPLPAPATESTRSCPHPHRRAALQHQRRHGKCPAGLLAGSGVASGHGRTGHDRRQVHHRPGQFRTAGDHRERHQSHQVPGSLRGLELGLSSPDPGLANVGLAGGRRQSWASCGAGPCCPRTPSQGNPQTP